MIASCDNINARIEKIITSYENGESIKQLAIRYGLKIKIISVLIANWKMGQKSSNEPLEAKKYLEFWKDRKKELTSTFKNLSVKPLFEIKDEIFFNLTLL